MKKSIMLDLRERATILAALAAWERMCPSQPKDLLAIASGNGQFRPLTAREVSKLASAVRGPDKPSPWLPIGEICRGSALCQDTLPALLAFVSDHIETVRDRAPEEVAHFRRVKKAATPKLLAENNDAAIELEEELIAHVLQAAAPPYTFAGAHPGNGSCLGIWPDDDAMEEAEDVGDLHLLWDQDFDGIAADVLLHNSSIGVKFLYVWDNLTEEHVFAWSEKY